MRKTNSSLFIAITVCLSVVSVSMSATGPSPDGKQEQATGRYSLEQFMKTVSVGGGFLDKNENRLLISSNETGVFNVFSIDIESCEKTQLTNFTSGAANALAYFPNDDRILYSFDKNGRQNFHIYVRHPDAGDQDLTLGEGTRENFITFSDDGKYFYTTNNSRDPLFFDLYEWDAATLESKLLLENKERWLITSVSPDRRLLVMVKTKTNLDSDIYLFDAAKGGEPTVITPHEGETAFSTPTFSKDGRYVYYKSNDNHDFAYLKRYSLESETHEEVLKTDWDVEFFGFSPKGTYLFIGVNEEGDTRVKIEHVQTGELLTFPDLPPGQISGVRFSASEKLISFLHGSSKMPNNLYVYDTESKQLRRLTDTLNSEIDPGDLAEAELIHFQARDGLLIRGYLFKPNEGSSKNRVPALLWVHDGPGFQTRPVYNAELQFLINCGYAVFAVNQRGSGGYGKAFLAADDRRYGREPLWDCVDAKNYLCGLDWVDPDKIGIMGFSLGGYMVLAGLAIQPDEFAVGVDLFGVCNVLRMLESLPKTWARVRQSFYFEFGDPMLDEQELRQISPYFHADKIKKPLLILHGARDMFVATEDVEQMVSTIKSKGGVVELVVFPDEATGFSSVENHIKGFEAVIKFLDKHLKGE